MKYLKGTFENFQQTSCKNLTDSTPENFETETMETDEAAKQQLLKINRSESRRTRKRVRAAKIKTEKLRNAQLIERLTHSRLVASERETNKPKDKMTRKYKKKNVSPKKVQEKMEVIGNETEEAEVEESNWEALYDQEEIENDVDNNGNKNSSDEESSILEIKVTGCDVTSSRDSLEIHPSMEASPPEESLTPARRIYSQPNIRLTNLNELRNTDNVRTVDEKGKELRKEKNTILDERVFVRKTNMIKEALDVIKNTYMNLWKMDAEKDHPQFVGVFTDDASPFSKLSRESQLSDLQTVLPDLEVKQLTTLSTAVADFLQYAANLRRGELLSNSSSQVSFAVVDKLLARLQAIQIRGINVFDGYDFISDSDLPPPGTFGAVGDHLKEKPATVVQWMADEEEEFYKSLTPEQLFLKEVVDLAPRPPSKKTLEEVAKIQMNTCANGYHLVPSIMALCDEDDGDGDVVKEMVEWDNGWYGKERNLLMNLKYLSQLQLENSPPRYKLDPNQYRFGKWENRVFDLIMCAARNLLTPVKVENNFLLMSPLPLRQNFVVANEGSFGELELVLDAQLHPYTLRYIRKYSLLLCQNRTLMDSLLTIKHPNVLKYMPGSGTATSFFVLTPLCQYNVTEYMDALDKEDRLAPRVDNILRQIFDGMLYLHEVGTVVHGNLKPSNVLVDHMEVVKLAEFGIFSMQYQDGRRPSNVTLVWWSRETNEQYLRLGHVQCNRRTDVHTLGVLAYFVSSAGEHAYGPGSLVDIVRRISIGTARVYLPNRPALADLVCWMLAYNPVDRPSIKEARAHIYFWAEETQWRFVLKCAGLSARSVILTDQLIFNWSDFLVALSTAHNNYIALMGEWRPIVRTVYPEPEEPVYESNSNVSEADELVMATHHQGELAERQLRRSPVELLKCVRRHIAYRYTHDHQLTYKKIIADGELRRRYIRAVPGFSLSLFRLLERTNWYYHPWFEEFFSNK